MPVSVEYPAEQLLAITPGSPQADLGSTDNVVVACLTLLEQVDLPTVAALLGHSRLWIRSESTASLTRTRCSGRLICWNSAKVGVLFHHVLRLLLRRDRQPGIDRNFLVHCYWDPWFHLRVVAGRAEQAYNRLSGFTGLGTLC